MGPTYYTSRGIKGPAWRWTEAERVQSVRSRRLLEMFDEHVHRARHYLLLCCRGAAGGRRAKALYPALAMAEAINTDPVTVAQLKIAVLGNMDRSEIACRLGLDEAVVEAWEIYFFDVRVAREAISYVSRWVIQHEAERGNNDLAARLKLAYGTGPEGARAILDADARMPVEEGERLFDCRMKLHLKFDAAMQMPLETDRQRLVFIRMHLNMMHKEKRLELAERRLALRCQEAADKHALATARLEAAQERAERKAALEAERAEQRRFQKELKRLRWESAAARRRAVYLAEAQAAAARAASSPLAQLRWGSSQDQTCEAAEGARAGRVDDRERVELSVAGPLGPDITPDDRCVLAGASQWGDGAVAREGRMGLVAVPA